ncbi:DUF6355 family natural product biosynthesis protein [Streptomyces klenkii]
MIVNRVAAAVVGAGLLVLCLSSTASANTLTSAGDEHSPCGFYTTNTDAYYNKCSGSDLSTRINVGVSAGLGDQVEYEKCVHDGTTWLGDRYSVYWAQDTGHPCGPSKGWNIGSGVGSPRHSMN